MDPTDYVVLIAYVVGVFVIGGIFGARIKSSGDMFAAGNQSPWWVAGLSGFMTMFSAGTFVVWGKIAYLHGLVAIVINLTYGIAAILVGWFVAGRWRKLGLTTAAEFVELRFGKAAVLTYTALNLTYKMLTVGVALYSVAKILSALVPLDPSHWLADPETSTLSLPAAIILVGTVVAIYTVVGGLWAVLMTDVIQFVVLMISVAFVAPLIIWEAGGVSGFTEKAPEGFFHLTSDEWTWWVIAGWCATQFFMIGAEWAFVQRYLCVPTPRAARLGAYLFGALYLISPVLWMLPPLIFRTINDSVDPEQAYILACQAVLPAGMVGLMFAAMFSATASMVDSQLNVFAGVITNDFYRNLFRPKASEAHLVNVGRVATTLLGLLLIVLALLVPSMGDAEKVIVKVTSLVVGPLLLPTIWGLFSRRIGAGSVWATVAAGFSVGFGVMLYGTFHQQLVEWLPGIVPATGLSPAATRTADVIAGVLVPLATLLILELAAAGQESAGWRRITERAAEVKSRTEPIKTSSLPGQMVAWSVGSCGALIGLLAIFAASDQVTLAAFAVTLLALAIVVGWLSRQVEPQTPPTPND